MLKADLNNLQRLSSLFYLVFRIFIKQLQICKYTSNIVYSCQKMYVTLFESGPNWQNSLSCGVKCHIDIYSCKQSSRLVISCLQKVQSKLKRYEAVYLVYFLSRILVVIFSSLKQGIYLLGSREVKFQIATFQKKIMIPKTLFLRYESLFLPLENFKLFNKREERSYQAG